MYQMIRMLGRSQKPKLITRKLSHEISQDAALRTMMLCTRRRRSNLPKPRRKKTHIRSIFLSICIYISVDNIYALHPKLLACFRVFTQNLMYQHSFFHKLLHQFKDLTSRNKWFSKIIIPINIVIFCMQNADPKKGQAIQDGGSTRQSIIGYYISYKNTPVL